MVVGPREHGSGDGRFAKDGSTDEVFADGGSGNGINGTPPPRFQPCPPELRAAVRRSPSLKSMCGGVVSRRREVSKVILLASGGGTAASLSTMPTAPSARAAMPEPDAFRIQMLRLIKNLVC